MVSGSEQAHQLPMLAFIKTRESQEIHRRKKMKILPHHYKLTRTYYRHADSPDFKRIITTAEGN